MKERPILMTPENAQKCHDGTKAQTRRIIAPQPVDDTGTGRWSYTVCSSDRKSEDQWIFCVSDNSGHRYTERGRERAVFSKRCPYGVVGDRLWVRENGWERPARTARMLREGADTWERFYFDALLDDGEAEELKGYGFKRRLSIHMPRWACRTVLEITEVRVERLKDVSEEDALAEIGSLETVTQEWVDDCEPGTRAHELATRMVGQQICAKLSFMNLWMAINGKESWRLNPWVWVLSFRKV